MEGLMEDTSEDLAFDDMLRQLARTPDVATSRAPLRQGRLLAGRFQIDEQLGEGGMGRVFAAFDSLRESRVALKVLGSITPRSILQMKQEFRAAAELSHPSLVRLHELFFDGVEWFFTMDLVDGVNVNTLRRRLERLPVALIQELFGQLARALVELHSAGTLHGDLKPSNFLITRTHQVVLLDFGLARPVVGSGLKYARAGTPGYMSPEQQSGNPYTEASDWYSFGVVLYEALTGQLPSAARALAGELRDAPAALRELCIELLQPEPSARPRGHQVLRRLGVKRDSIALGVLAPAACELVGRRRELADLRAAFGDAVRGHAPVVTLVQGPSGIGKTALVQHFVSGVQADGGIVLSGRCRERESVSHKAIDVLVDDLIAWLDGEGSEAAASLLPPGMGDLTRLFPALRAVPSVARAVAAQATTSNDTAAKVNAIRTFHDLLVNIAARAPLVLWIDDLQWADVDSTALLAPLLAETAGLPLLLVGSYRSSENDWGPMLNALYDGRTQLLPPPREIALAPLPPAEARSLALRLLDSSAIDASSVAKTIADEAGGHPLLISELARGGGGELLPAVSTSLSQLIGARIQGLTSDARSLVETLALAGAPLTRAVLRLAGSLDASRTERALDMLRGARLVRSGGMEEDRALDIIHDRIREIIVQCIPAAKQAASHFALALALTAQRQIRADLIAAHFSGAGAMREAGTHWLAAADNAAHNLAFERAAQLYELAAVHAPLDVEQRHDVRMRQAQMLGYAGRGQDAAELYLSGAKDRPGDQIIQLQRLAAEQLLLVGQWARGLEVIDKVLRTLGMRPIRGGYGLLISFVLGRLRVRLRGLRFRQRASEELSPKRLASIDAAFTVACSLGAVDPMRGADLQNEHLLLALRAGEPTRLLRALMLEVSYSAAPGRPANQRMHKLLQLVDSLSAHTQDPAALGMSRLIKGLALYLEGDVAGAHEHLESAVNTFTTRCAGAVWETMTAHRFSIASLFFLGRFRELHARVPPLVAQATAQNNQYAGTWCRTHFATIAWLVKDDVAEAQKRLRDTLEELTAHYPLATSSVLISEVYLDFYTGELEKPLQRIHARWEEFTRLNLFRVGILRLQLWHLRAASALLAARNARMKGAVAEERRLLAEARTAANRVAREPAPIARALASLLFGGIELANNMPRLAAQHFERSVASFETLGMKLFAAAAGFRHAEIAQGEHRTRLLNDAQAAFEAEGVTSWRRMVNLLAPAGPS
jgi:serine/threonine protein kinase